MFYDIYTALYFFVRLRFDETIYARNANLIGGLV
jgi:hypothetical protein